MSELFDDDPRQTPPPRGTSRRTRALVITAVIVVVAFFLLTTFAGLWTDHLWYDALGYGGVFNKLLWTRVGLFLAFGVVMAVAVGLAIALAYRGRPFILPGGHDNGMDRYREAVTPIRTYLLIAVSVIAGVFAGTSATGQWRTFLMWRNGSDFGQTDPYFGRDIGFYVFDLPWYHLLVNFVMALAVVALLANVLVHYLYGGIRLQQAGDRVSRPAQVQLSVLLAVFVLAKAVDYWLDRFDVVYNDSPLITGPGYTADHAILPAKVILAGIAVICAVLFLVNIWRRTWLLPGVGAALLMVSAILLGLIWPAIVEGFQVRPSPAEKEAPYVAKNIAATRAAYGIDDDTVTVENYTQDAQITDDLATQLDNEVKSAPLVDPQLVHAMFEENQQVKGYYTVPEVLDVDHYQIEGQDRALVLGVRELNQSGIADRDQTWTNLHTVYTHGSGVIAAYANQRNLADDTESTAIQWAQGSGTTQDDMVDYGPGDFEQRVYFGEQSPSYSVVGRPEGAAPVELDLAGSGENEGRTTYDGKGGVAIGSTWRQLLYAIKFGSSSFLLSERVNENSQILYNRTPRERVEKVAPWLTLDDDAYPVVVDGRILWVLDGYTTTDRYPGSEKESFKTMTDDVQQQSTGLQTLPTDEINYMRNAVKATVDAYDGTVTLYAWDEDDPILKAWSSAFPGTVKPKADIPEDLLPHLRYPEDLFKVQRYQLAKYHVTDPQAFIQGSDWWSVPEDPNSPDHLLPPYRLFVDDRASSAEVWSMSTTFVPRRRNNLSAVMTVNSDPTTTDYGKITVLERPDQQTQGPGQVVTVFKSDQDIAAALLPYRGTNAGIRYGNLLTIPTSDYGLINVEPVYAQQVAGSSYPVLALVLVAYDGHLGYGGTLSEALSVAVENAEQGSGTEEPPSTEPPTTTPPTTTPPTTEPPTTTPPTGTLDEQAKALLADADRLFAAATQAAEQGDFVKRERLLKRAQQKIEQALALLG
ncbi:UPF0182 family protein [Nocardioides sp.]|uniref:UPF0182 family membrane protein n=1 Tax=Nocardioides sp. TaxID=35761 RepID=UPI0039E28586